MNKKSDNQKTEVSEIIRRPEAVVARMPKDAFKAMFYLFAGRPDSKTKLFRRKICITPDDIYYLNDLIVEKLRLHQIEQVVTSATIKFAKKEIIQFGTWVEFRSFNWKVAQVTQEISLRWDFLIKLIDYGVPQRHTLVMKMSGAPNPRDVFQMLMSQDLDDDDLEDRLGMCVARVDFISHRLADELIEVIAQWNSSLREAAPSNSWFSELVKFDKYIARLVNYSIPVVFAAAAFILAPILVPKGEEQLTDASFVIGLQWLILSGLTLYIMSRISKHLARQCYSAINEFGTFTPFQLTNGDTNSIEKYRKKNNSKIRAFFFSFGVAFLLNIVTGIVVWLIVRK